MPKTTDGSNSRKMLRASRSGRIEAEEGQPLSDQQALALAIQYFADAMELAAGKIESAAKHRG